jgi:hypothetical protein
MGALLAGIIEAAAFKNAMLTGSNNSLLIKM